MDDLYWSSFTRRIAVRAPIATIYKAWTCKQEIERWFLSSADFADDKGRALATDESVGAGGTYGWRWFNFDAQEHGRILKANGTDHLQFTFAGECPVDVQLSQIGKDVVVELTQSKIPTDDASKKGIRLGCDQGWSFFLVDLKSVYEGGLDLRDKEGVVKAAVNS